MELYRKHRPKKLSEVIGQPEAVKALQRHLDDSTLPHALMLTGQSGVGKTTIARILRRELGCGRQDWAEINAAESRGIDTVREIGSRIMLAPMNGRCRMWCIDEAARLTYDAQSSLLKMLEDTPGHVWFILCTTDPDRLLPTIRTRCPPLKLSPLSFSDMQILLTGILAKEGIDERKVSGKVIKQIIEIADGSARTALQLLDRVIGLEGEDEQMRTLVKSETRKAGIDIARALIDRRSRWPDIARLLEAVDGDAEEIRRTVLGYSRQVLLGGKERSARAYLVICCFESNTYDSGQAGLCRMAYEVFSTE